MAAINLYTIVTNDEYEVPVKCDIRVAEAAEFFGTSRNNIRRMLIRPPKKQKYKVVVSGKVEFDQTEYSKHYDMAHERSEYFKEYAKTHYKTRKSLSVNSEWGKYSKVFWNFYNSGQKEIEIEFETDEEALKVSRSAYECMSNKRIYDVSVRRRRNVLYLKRTEVGKC